MIRRNRRPDWRRIKTLRSYTIDEAARALRVHRNAVRHWLKKCGLPAITDKRPYLIHGTDLVAFLKARQASQRQRCGPGQFYCLKCRQPRGSAQDMVEYQAISPLRGVLIGLCPVCETLLRRFVSHARLASIARDFNVQVKHQQESLRDTAAPNLDCHSGGPNRPCRPTTPRTNESSAPTSST